MRNQLDVALKYAKAGIKVFPACPKTKKPMTKGGFKDATSDVKAVKQWFTKYSNAFVASPCDDQFTVIDCDFKKPKSFESLSKIFGFVNETPYRVTTGSNGAHYYFKSDDELTRRINFIPDIDLLATGGYAILPDDNTYKQSGSLEEFIESLGDLPTINESLKKHLTGEQEIDELSLYRSESKEKVKKSESSLESKNVEKQEDEEAKIVQEKDRVLSEKTYETSQRRTEHSIDFDGTPIQLKKGSVDSDTVNALFHNKEIQKTLAKFIGVSLPDSTTNKSPSFRSVLPSHFDKNPSMGCRWANSSGRNHLVVRDFSDHYGDGKVDYNVVRLYACKHKGKTNYLSSPEFYVWFMRMLDEAGVVEFDKAEINVDLENLTKSERKVAEGFVSLLSVKSLYKDGNAETAFSNRFASSWCGVSASLISRAKAKLIRYGLMEKCGSHGEGFFACSLFKYGEGVIDKSEMTVYDVNAVFKQDIKKKVGQSKPSSKILSKKKGEPRMSKENQDQEEPLNNDNEESLFDRSLKDKDITSPTKKRSAREELEDAKLEEERRKRKIKRLIDDGG